MQGLPKGPKLLCTVKVLASDWVQKATHLSGLIFLFPCRRLPACQDSDGGAGRACRKGKGAWRLGRVLHARRLGTPEPEALPLDVQQSEGLPGARGTRTHFWGCVLVSGRHDD